MIIQSCSLRRQRYKATSYVSVTLEKEHTTFEAGLYMPKVLTHILETRANPHHRYGIALGPTRVLAHKVHHYNTL